MFFIYKNVVKIKKTLNNVKTFFTSIVQTAAIDFAMYSTAQQTHFSGRIIPSDKSTACDEDRIS